MLKHKLCEKCGTKNHSKNKHCKSCGELLPETAKLSIEIIAGVVAFALIIGVAFAKEPIQKKFFNKSTETISNQEQKTDTAPVVNNEPQPDNKKEEPKKTNTTPSAPVQSYTPPPKTCNEGLKVNAINQENYNYQQLVNAEGTRHRAELDRINKYMSSACSGSHYQSACGVAQQELEQENNNYKQKLADLETQHNRALETINNVCY